MRSRRLRSEGLGGDASRSLIRGRAGGEAQANPKAAPQGRMQAMRFVGRVWEGQSTTRVDDWFEAGPEGWRELIPRAAPQGKADDES